ncbi:MAG: toll/interleukin-1 receptor domain-containing protein [Pyrinomonadaceae bacterium]|nr:toll/interleukin-1 receptor domain-containing protein [Phycisphaerales bacterium]
MIIPDSPYVQPLAVADRQYLQVLVDKFRLTVFQNGSRSLDLTLRDKLPTIWNREGRRHFHDAIMSNPKEAAKAKSLLQRACAGSNSKQTYSVPFRYANGGALPVVYLDGKEYYCLFYRQIFPIGWNIANGGSDNRHELLSPRDVIDRELREELVIFNPEKGYRYVFQGDIDKPSDWPEFAHARRAIERMYPGINFSAMNVEPLPHKWIDGRDTLLIRAGKTQHQIDGCYITISAEDFGIELDRIIRFRLHRGDVIVDAETLELGPLESTSVVNAPIGLFEVQRFNEQLHDDCVEFLPDIYFANGALQQQGNARWYVEERFFPWIKRFMHKESVKRFAKETRRRFDLCPVTRSVITRYRDDTAKAKGSRAAPVPDGANDAVDAFICCGGDDKKYGEQVASRLTNHGRRVFFYVWDNRPGLWAPYIDRAIDSPSCKQMFVVASTRDNVMRPAVEYEYYSFHQEILRGAKPKEGLMTLVTGVDTNQLPKPLSNYRVYPFEPDNLNDCLGKLGY